MKSVKFSATIGIVSGYGHNNESNDSAAAIVAKVWQESAAKIFAETGVYVSATVSESLTVYHTDWGCPVGGEKTATVEGSANPQFVEDVNKWRKIVLKIVKVVKATLQQSTIVVEFSEIDHVYLADQQ